MTDYEFSTGYVESIVRALKRSPKAHEILAKLSPSAKALYENPWSEPWQPALVMEEIGEVATAALGESVYEELTWVTMKERMGPILVPMLKSTIATKSPGNILKKLNDLVRVAIKGVEISYQPEGPNAGVVQVSYPRPVAAHVMKSWFGVIRFVFDITSPGQVTQSQQLSQGATLQLVVAWSEIS